MKDILNNIEIEKIEAFYNDEIMREAVRKVLFYLVYTNGVAKKEEKFSAKNGAFNKLIENPELSNEAIGADLRAQFYGVHTVEEGFAQLSQIKKEKKVVEKKENKAI